MVKPPGFYEKIVVDKNDIRRIDEAQRDIPCLIGREITILSSI
jgi:hypothetical protein